MRLLDALGTVFVPPLCLACGRLCRGEASLCEACGRRLAEARPLRGAGPPGVDAAWSSAAHEGVARALVAALKFRRLLPVAELMADRIRRLAPATLEGGEIVPVPTAPVRSLLRGFDPAAEIAAALAERSGAVLRTNCLRRVGPGRQVGRRRADRLGRPPRIEVEGPVPRSVLLVDDVLTTGATISSCASALRGGGALRVVAITFSRRM
jgi:predicted amidophosphoribosyltransferase